jgi:hypothetical protein
MRGGGWSAGLKSIQPHLYAQTYHRTASDDQFDEILNVQRLELIVRRVPVPVECLAHCRSIREKQLESC